MPKKLKDEAEQIARRQLLSCEHVKPLTRFVDDLVRQYPEKDIPYFDPLDGGIRAECLFVLESPGRRATRKYGSGFISRDNNDESAKNFLEALESVEFPREMTVLWNIVPWDLSTNGKGRPPTRAELEDGLPYLYQLIDRLPRLRAIVLVGKKAQRIGPELVTKYDDVSLFSCPHPSPKNLNTSPQNRTMLRDALKQVKAFLDRHSAPD